MLSASLIVTLSVSGNSFVFSSNSCTGPQVVLKQKLRVFSLQRNIENYILLCLFFIVSIKTENNLFNFISFHELFPQNQNSRIEWSEWPFNRRLA